LNLELMGVGLLNAVIRSHFQVEPVPLVAYIVVQ
jgi:hypothetical protein